MFWVILNRSLKYKTLSKKERTPKEERVWKVCVDQRKKLLHTLYGPHGVSDLISQRYSIMGASNSHPNILFPQGYIDDPEFNTFRELYSRLRDLFRLAIANSSHDVTHEQLISALGRSC